jgi:hypothetical protein
LPFRAAMGRVLQLALVGFACSIAGSLLHPIAGAPIATVSFAILLPAYLWAFERQDSPLFLLSLGVTLFLTVPLTVIMWPTITEAVDALLGPGLDDVTRSAVRASWAGGLATMVVIATFVLFHPRRVPWIFMIAEVAGCTVVAGLLIAIGRNVGESLQAAAVLAASSWGGMLIAWLTGLGAMIGFLHLRRDRRDARAGEAIPIRL